MKAVQNIETVVLPPRQLRDVKTHTGASERRANLDLTGQTDQPSMFDSERLLPSPSSIFRTALAEDSWEEGEGSNFGGVSNRRRDCSDTEIRQSSTTISSDANPTLSGTRVTHSPEELPSNIRFQHS